ncbi:MAG: nitroreductase family protein [Bacteroidota bacterium]
MKTFIEMVQQRQSVRKYDDRPVEKEKIDKCIEAARLAPSACNSQPWKFIVAYEKNLAEEVAKATFNPVINFNRFAKSATVMIAITIERPKTIAKIGESIKDREFPLIDIGIAAQHFCLQAEELGLGTCMIGWFNEKRVKELLEIPDKKRVGLLISVGYPVENYKFRIKIRKSTGKMSSYNKY